MKTTTFEKRTFLNATAEDVFAWHMAPGALGKLLPPGDRVAVLAGAGEPISEGSRVTLRIGGPVFGRRWIAEHRDIVPGRQFRDVMVKGPFAAWEHTHCFEPAEGGGSWLVDRIEYALPLGIPGRLFLGGLVRRKLERTFTHRHEVTASALSKRPVEGTPA